MATEALDALEREQFWTAAEAAAAHRQGLRLTERAALSDAEADVQRWLDSL